MSSLASTLAIRQNSYFTIWSNQNFNQTEKSLTIDRSQQPKTESAELKNPFKNVLQFFNDTELVKIEDHRVLPAGNLYYKDSLILNFSLTEKYTVFFPLLRGLFGFGKLSGLTVSSNAENKTFQVVISSGREENVIGYFGSLFSELVREFKFKSALKDLLYAQQEAIKIQKAGLLNLGKSLR